MGYDLRYCKISLTKVLLIVHCKSCILVQTIGFVLPILEPFRKKVLVYDSAYIRWDDETIGLLKTQFHCTASNISILQSVQKQLGGKECDLYAIANATSVAFGKDPGKMTYQESVMHAHLCHCFSEKNLEYFQHLSNKSKHIYACCIFSYYYFPIYNDLLLLIFHVFF